MEERGITFGDIAKMIKKRVWWVVAVTLIVTIVATCLTAFVFNKGKDDYSLSFRLEYPNSENMMYPNGDAFNYETIIYADNLLAAKNSDKKFSSIDTEKLASNIDIVAEQKEVVENNVKKNVLTGKYTITVKSAYFTDEKHAKEFIVAIINETMKDVKDYLNKIDYFSKLNTYDVATTYEEKMSALRNQYNSLLSNYDRIINSGKYGTFAYNEKTLSELRAELVGKVSNKLTYLSNDLSVNKYLTSQSKVAEVLAKNKILEKEKEENTVVIESLKNEIDDLIKRLGSLSSTQLSETLVPYTERIATLTERNATIDNELKATYSALGYTHDGNKWNAPLQVTIPNDTNFKQELEEVKGILDESTNICKNAVAGLYEENTKVELPTANLVVTDNGTSVIFVAIAAALLSFLVVCLIVCLVDYPKYKKAKQERQ